MRAAGTAALAAAALCLIAPAPAQASPCNLDVIDPGIFVWEFGDSGFMDDASHAPSGRGDAFDFYGELRVSSNGGASWLSYTNPNPTGCAYEDAGREVAYPADTTTVPGLQLRRRVFVPGTGIPFARWIDALTNTTGAPITVRLRWGGNLGSDSDTVVAATSDGDTMIDVPDRWAATTGGGGPDVAHVFGSTFATPPDAAEVVGELSVGSLNYTRDVGHVTAEYRDVTVQPGATVAYMHVAALRLTAADAITAGQALAGQPDAVETGISPAEAAQIRNWNIGDRERDGVAGDADNCPSVANPGQGDADGDGRGDPCDADDDNDGVADPQDACPVAAGSGSNGCSIPRGLGPGTPGQTDDVAPHMTVTQLSRRPVRRALLRRGLAFRVGCSEACSLQVELLGRVRSVHIAAAGDIELGSRSLGRATGTRTVGVRISRKLRRAVRRGARLKLRITATDAAKNRAVVSRSVRVR